MTSACRVMQKTPKFISHINIDEILEDKIKKKNKITER